jgi:hypothetical protein
MFFNEINHKIDMKVKKECQVIISTLLQSMLKSPPKILPSPYPLWASPTILDSTKGQYTYREFNPFLTSATQSEAYSPAGNLACLNPNMDCNKGLIMT